MKLISRLFNFCVLLIIAALIFHNFTARTLLAFGLRSALGVPVSVESARVDFLDTFIGFSGIEIKNPPDFGEGVLARAPFIGVDFEISSLWEGRLHFEEVDLDLAELHVMRLPDGRVNLTELKPLAAGRREKERNDSSSRRGERRESAAAPQFHIDRLVLSLGRATYSDLTGGAPAVKAFNLGVNRSEYRDITGAGDTARIIAWESLKKMGVASLDGVLRSIGLDLPIQPQNLIDKALAAFRGR